MIALWTVLAVVAVALAFLALVVKGILQTIDGLVRPVERQAVEHRPVRPREGLPVGTMAPVVSGRTIEGGLFDARTLVGKYVVVLASQSCSACRRLVAELDVAAAGEGWPPTVVVARSENGDDIAGWLRVPSRLRVLLDGAPIRWSEQFATSATPHVFVVDGGVIAAQGTTDSVDGVVTLIGDGRGMNGR